MFSIAFSTVATALAGINLTARIWLASAAAGGSGSAAAAVAEAQILRAAIILIAAVCMIALSLWEETDARFANVNKRLDSIVDWVRSVEQADERRRERAAEEAERDKLYRQLAESASERYSDQSD
jgi:hypothetical protein